MSVSIIRKPIYGSLLEYNKLCSGEPYISIPGIYAKAPARLDVDNDIMSKHILMSGGTGSGKTNAIYHILSQLKKRLTPDDILIVFDTKGDYYGKFGKSDDLVIGNSVEYRDKSEASYIGDGKNNQSLGVYAEMLSNLRKILVGVFADTGSFSIRNFVRQRGGKTLFIEYDLALGNTLSPIYSLLIDLALKETLGRSEHKGNVYMFFDEFRLLPYLQHIDDAVNFGRSLGLKIVAGIQSVNQMTELYGEYRGKNILAGFSSVFAFRANDADTRKFITDLYGENVVMEQRKSLSNVMTEEQKNAHVVEDWDMRDLNIGEAIVGFPFREPFKFQFDEYRKVR